jgi:hypothetical protein
LNFISCGRMPLVSEKRVERYALRLLVALVGQQAALQYSARYGGVSTGGWRGHVVHHCVVRKVLVSARWHAPPRPCAAEAARPRAYRAPDYATPTALCA